MLIEFSITNFLSFKDKVTFSMVEAPLREKNLLFKNNCFSVEKNTNLLKSAVIYGANASGKSNFINSLAFFINHINQSKFITEKDLIPIQPYLLSSEMSDVPCSFEIIIFKNSCYYRYGFELNSTEILKEWLYVKHEREAPVFKRDKMEFDIQKKFKIMNELKTRKMIPKNSLLLSKSAQFNEGIAADFLDALSDLRIISGIKDEVYREFTINTLDNPIIKDKTLELLNFADFSIEDIRRIIVDGENVTFHANLSKNTEFKIERQKQKIPDVLFLKNIYDKNNNIVGQYPFNLSFQESEGTNKFFHIAGPVLDCLTHGYSLIVDELDTKLHPLLVLKIVELFHSKDSNPKNAQLIFTTHNTSLFSTKVFRRDQIWLTEKNSYGSTDLFSLADFEKDKKKVRNDEAFEKNYLLGKYGAVPFLGRLDNFEVIADKL